MVQTTFLNYIDSFRVQIQLQVVSGKVLYNALIDMGASHNLISFDTWNQLGRLALIPLPINVKGVNGKTSYIIGILKTQLFYANPQM